MHLLLSHPWCPRGREAARLPSHCQDFHCRVRPARSRCCSKRSQLIAVKSSSTDESETVEVGWLWTMGTSGAASMTKVALRSANLKAKKSLGQNFLTDDKILADIVAVAGVSKGDIVIEVGPGTGNLTRHLIKTGAQITAIEKDDALFTKLETMFTEGNFALVHGDVLRVKLEDLIVQLLEGHRGSSSKVKLVANLPYNITKEFLQLVLPLGDKISEVHIMIQDEVAKRLLQSTPGGRLYRAVNIFTHYYSQPRYRFRIPKTKYFPAPGVDGALVTFRLRPPSARLPVPSEKFFFMLVKKAFSERRKMMRNSLQPLVATAQVEAALTTVNLPVDCRAQDLTVEDFVAFAWQVYHQQQGAAAAANDLEGVPVAPVSSVESLVAAAVSPVDAPVTVVSPVAAV